MSKEQNGQGPLSDEALQDLVAQTDTGGRAPGGVSEKIILWAAAAWSLFQLWIASPLPFMIGLGVFNDTEARSIHSGFRHFSGLSGLSSA